MSTDLQIKRIYDPASRSDGARILVDRLWPRGISKDKAALTTWLKEIAPSTELRQWFHHDPARWTEFQKRYHTELKANLQAVEQLHDYIKAGSVTLLYGAQDAEHNHAHVLANYMRKHIKTHHDRY